MYAVVQHWLLATDHDHIAVGLSWSLHPCSVNQQVLGSQKLQLHWGIAIVSCGYKIHIPVWMKSTLRPLNWLGFLAISLSIPLTGFNVKTRSRNIPVFEATFAMSSERRYKQANKQHVIPYKRKYWADIKFGAKFGSKLGIRKYWWDLNLAKGQTYSRPSSPGANYWWD